MSDNEWRPSDPKLDPLRLYMINDAGERLDIQPISESGIIEYDSEYDIEVEP